MVKHPKTNSIQNFTIYKYNNNLCYMPMQFLCALLESYYSEYRKLSQAGRVLTTCLFVSTFAFSSWCRIRLFRPKEHQNVSLSMFVLTERAW